MNECGMMNMKEKRRASNIHGLSLIIHPFKGKGNQDDHEENGRPSNESISRWLGEPPETVRLRTRRAW
jgi:hypothetical protein